MLKCILVDGSQYILCKILFLTTSNLSSSTKAVRYWSYPLNRERGRIILLWPHMPRWDSNPLCHDSEADDLPVEPKWKMIAG